MERDRTVQFTGEADAMKTRTSKFTIVCDSREGRPWSFEGITERYRGQDVPLHIPTIKKCLATADYSIVGYESKIAIERKSATDLAGTLTRGRKRFERELIRGQSLDYMAVIIETTWEQFLKYVHERTKATPKSLDSSILAFSMRYPKVHWIWRPNRSTAARTAYKIFDLYLKEQKKNASKQK